MNTKEKIQNVAIKMFSGKGYTETSMREISAELNISKAALYYHFSNKEEIFTSIVENIFKETIKFNKELASKNIPTWEILKKWIEHAINCSVKKDNIGQLIRQIMMGKFKNVSNNIDIFSFINVNFEILNSVIKKGIEEKEIRSDIDSKFLTMNFLGSLHSVLGPMRNNTKNLTNKKISESLYKLIYDGMKKQ
ncbi:MAG: TetR/AcrR family transcriptional regulator [Candidatus Marinimicrobia bacterium]|jgi:AcrR family transcriptional regulator|nr:TetR/AcrR family transcriptional regulator [Candidatus Neomarinimicrobiota bacterium]